MRHAARLEQGAVDRIRAGKQTRYTFNSVAGYKIGDLLDITTVAEPIVPLEGETPEETAERQAAATPGAIVRGRETLLSGEGRALTDREIAAGRTPERGVRDAQTVPGSGSSDRQFSEGVSTSGTDIAGRTGREIGSSREAQGRVGGRSEAEFDNTRGGPERVEDVEPGPAHDLVHGDTAREGLTLNSRDSRFIGGATTADRVAYANDVVTVVVSGQREHTLNETELADARAEGFETIEDFKADWDKQKRNRAAKRRSASNPRVYAVSFKLVVDGLVPNVQPPSAGTVEPTFPSETARIRAGEILQETPSSTPTRKLFQRPAETAKQAKARAKAEDKTLAKARTKPKRQRENVNQLGRGSGRGVQPEREGLSSRAPRGRNR